MAIIGGIISGAFSSGVMVTTLSFVKKSAEQAHHRIDAHIDDHMSGKFERRGEAR